MSSQPQTLDDPAFGHLEWEGPWWRGQMRFPALAECRIRWQLTPDEHHVVPVTAAAQEVDGSVAVAVHDEAGDVLPPPRIPWPR